MPHLVGFRDVQFELAQAVVSRSPRIRIDHLRRGEMFSVRRGDSVRSRQSGHDADADCLLPSGASTDQNDTERRVIIRKRWATSKDPSANCGAQVVPFERLSLLVPAEYLKGDFNVGYRVTGRMVVVNSRSWRFSR